MTMLVVMHGDDPDAVLDQLLALQWSCTDPLKVVITTANPKLVAMRWPTCVWSVKHRSHYRADGFARADGIWHAMKSDLKFDVLLCLRDDVLPIGRGLNLWAERKVSEYGAGLLGVKDNVRYDGEYEHCLARFAEWGAPYENCEVAPETIVDPYFFMSYALAADLFSRGLLTPEGHEQWPHSYGLYLSWVTQMLEYPQVCWGEVGRPTSPLFSNPTRHVSWQPSPHILASDFMLYYSVRHVTGYPEAEIRERYRNLRLASERELCPT